jgi:hypothetical protein
MDLAEARSREALLKQEVDDLRDELYRQNEPKATQPTSATAALNAKPSKWNLW